MPGLVIENAAYNLRHQAEMFESILKPNRGKSGRKKDRTSGAIKHTTIVWGTAGFTWFRNRYPLVFITKMFAGWETGPVKRGGGAIAQASSFLKPGKAL